MNAANNSWVVKTDKGEISGRALVVATNAYSGEFSKSLVPDIAHEVMPVLSWQMATQPLSDNARKTIIPGRQAMSDTHGELYFARYDARNRLVTGGAVIGPGNKAERIKARVAERLQRLWPQIGDVSFDYVWNGYVGMTTDFLPRIHRLGPDAYGWTGCNGRAVALTIPLGDELSKAVRGVPERISRCRSRSGADRRAWSVAPTRAADADGLPAARRAGNCLTFNQTVDHARNAASRFRVKSPPGIESSSACV